MASATGEPHEHHPHKMNKFIPVYLPVPHHALFLAAAASSSVFTGANGLENIAEPSCFALDSIDTLIT
jgi:hypothetical protein